MEKFYLKKMLSFVGLAALTIGLNTNANAQSGYALVLDGSTQYMTVPDASSLNATTANSLTLIMRLKYTGGSGGTPRPFSKRATSAPKKGYEVFLGTRNSKQRAAFTAADQAGTNVGSYWNDNSTVDFLDQAWHHVAVVIDNTGAKTALSIYVDGVVQSATGASLSDCSNNLPLIIGADNAFNNKFKGAIDDIRIYNYALTSTQLDADKALASVNGSTPGLIAAWDFENVSGATVTDVSGNGHNGTLAGTPAVLPLNITNFTSSTQKNTITYTWQTANEHNVNHFEAEYSNDGQNFVKAGSVAVKGNGSYSFSFVYGGANANVYTRIKAVDNDGAATYSEIRTVLVGNETSFAIAPNPVKDILTVSTGLEATNATLSIVNVNGAVVKTVKFNNNTTSINVSNLPKGIYVAKLVAGGQTQIQKFVKL